MKKAAMAAFLVVVWIVKPPVRAGDIQEGLFGRPAELIYSGPERIEKAGIGQFEFNKVAKGAELFVASHNANLREKPGVESAVVAILPMATRVKVLKPSSGPTSVSGKVDRWYEVEVLDGPARGERGHLFGMLLTPAAWVIDLDGDGEDEIVTAAFASNFEIRIRIREPEVDEPDSVSLDVRSAGGAFAQRKGGRARVSVLPRAKAGIALIQVHAYVEACADYATHWISYSVPGRKPGVLGEPKLALTQGGIADSPVHSDYAVTFDPAKRTAVVVRTNKEEGEDGKETVTKTTTRYKLEDGVYLEQPWDPTGRREPVP